MSKNINNVLISLPSGSSERKALPLTTGVLDYFPSALAEVAKISVVGNKQHHPDKPLHWARGVSVDHADCIVRHLLQRGTFDSDGMRHSAKLAWRALALLQEELEAEAGFMTVSELEELKAAIKANVMGIPPEGISCVAGWNWKRHADVGTKKEEPEPPKESFLPEFVGEPPPTQGVYKCALPRCVRGSVCHSIYCEAEGLEG